MLIPQVSGGAVNSVAATHSRVPRSFPVQGWAFPS